MMERDRRLRLLVAALAVIFFLTPMALIVGGSRPRAFENRRLEPAPRLSQGWNLFTHATRYLIDRMPLRDQAVHANGWIDAHVYNTVPVYGQNGLGGVLADQALPFSGRPAQDRASLGDRKALAPSAAKPGAPPPASAAQVDIGSDGWLFLSGVQQRACAPFIPFTRAIGQWETLLRIIRASGRRAELLVTPDKSTVYPEYLPPSTPDRACGAAGSAALWQLIEAPKARRAGIIGLRQALLEAKRRSGTLLYFKTDSHWNSVGALALLRSALPPLSATVRVRPGDVVSGPRVPWTGDLLGLSGQGGGETAPTATVRRPPGAAVIAPASLIIGDSYSDIAFHAAGPSPITPVQELQDYFRRLKYLSWDTATPRAEADAIAAAHNVVLQTVEREFDYRATDVGFVSPSFIALVRRTLAGHPLSRP